MTSQSKIIDKTDRIHAVDMLRAIAIAGIVMIHFIEHLNFYLFPEPSGPLMAKIDAVVWDTIFFLLAGKMYAIFSLLFGFSFFIQFYNAAKRNIDFSVRFIWRMVILFCLGLIDLCFYNGDILCVYAVCGILIIPFFKSSNKVLFATIVFFFMQPVEIIYILLGLINPDTKPLDLGSGPLFGAILPAQSDGALSDVAVAGLRYGLTINFTWAIEHGRMTQTICLFLLGLYLGRKNFFRNEGSNGVVWKKILLAGTVSFVILLPLYLFLPERITNTCIKNSLSIMLDMWKNFSMMLMIVTSLLLLYYNTSLNRFLNKLTPYGKMSLTNYIGQSIVGSLVFYNWGLGLYQHLGHTSSLILGILFILIQYSFSVWWLKTHRRGPFEEIWSRATKWNPNFFGGIIGR